MGTGRAGQTVVQFIAERTAGQKAVNLPFPLPVALDNNATGAMNETDGIIRLVHLLATFAAAAPTIATCAVFYKCS